MNNYPVRNRRAACEHVSRIMEEWAHHRLSDAEALSALLLIAQSIDRHRLAGYRASRRKKDTNE